MANALTWFASEPVQSAKPALGVQYNIGKSFQSGSLNLQYAPIRFDPENLSGGTVALGTFDVLSDAQAACQADYDQLPPPSK
jgi:hypothetical protein